ncbi:MAG: hypothetical protein QOH61_919 [Chloroflexota bacterium]|jgi:hypothetical protein|nr:hypothetical protein [Chloroflexota bacterium]
MSAVRIVEALIGLSRSARLGAIVLVVTNLIPLAGVLWWGWDAFVIVFLYWLENGIVGVVTVLKIRRAGRARNVAWIGIASFFTVHYGLFWVVHGVFVLVLPVFARVDFSLPRISPLGLLLALAALAVSHFGNYRLVFVREGEYLRAEPQRLMWQPYARLFTLHFVILFGALLAALLGQPIALVVLLVLFKIAFELRLFLLARRGPTAFGVTPAEAPRERPT